jgi:hypothetical protein
MNGNLKRPYQKRYDPSDLTHIINLDSPHRSQGEVEVGSIVTVTAHYGPFRWVRDAEGNELSVGRYSLVPVSEPHAHAEGRLHQHLGEGGRHVHVTPFDGHSLAGIRYVTLEGVPL